MRQGRKHRLGEFTLIAKRFAPLAARAPGAAGLTDDAATLSLSADEELVVTMDALVEGVHFFGDDPADLVARKALRVNLSDLAAKGARPYAYLLALCLPDWVDDAWLERFTDGLATDQECFSIDLIGGDTTRTPGPLTVSITAFGIAPKGRTLRRSGAVVGEAVFVSGTIGDGGAGLAIAEGAGADLAPGVRDGLLARYRLPEPRCALGPRLIGLASSALDVSDGLLADLGHITGASGVGIQIEAAKIPLSGALRAFWSDSSAVLRAATAGDDYEIAFTAPRSAEPALTAAASEAGVPITEIGIVVAASGVSLIDAAGRPMAVKRPGYTHF